MYKFAIFVDGSNLFGTLKYLGVRIHNYELFYRFIFEKAVDKWAATFKSATAPSAQLFRVYWYVVDKIDEWDFDDPKTKEHIKNQFLNDRDLKDFKNLWMSHAGTKLKDTKPTSEQIQNEALEMCLFEARGLDLHQFAGHTKCPGRVN